MIDTKNGIDYAAALSAKTRAVRQLAWASWGRGHASTQRLRLVRQMHRPLCASSAHVQRLLTRVVSVVGQFDTRVDQKIMQALDVLAGANAAVVRMVQEVSHAVERHLETVSYTHLDVYKRQGLKSPQWPTDGWQALAQLAMMLLSLIHI